jgi:hypothetical protein
VDLDVPPRARRREQAPARARARAELEDADGSAFAFVRTPREGGPFSFRKHLVHDERGQVHGAVVDHAGYADAGVLPHGHRHGVLPRLVVEEVHAQGLELGALHDVVRTRT